MEDENAIEVYSDEVKVQRMLAVLERQVQTGCDLTTACKATSLPLRTFYNWLGEGRLTEYLASAKQSRQTAAQAQAIEAIPDVVGFMIKLATGRVEIRGANPVAAARWLADIAGMGTESPAKSGDGKEAPSILAYIPQMAIVQIERGKVVTDSEGRIRAIQANNDDDKDDD